MKFIPYCIAATGGLGAVQPPSTSVTRCSQPGSRSAGACGWHRISNVGNVDMSEQARTPWHLWVIGILMLFWSAGGTFDYVMTQTRNASYMSQFTPEQLDYFYGFPPWVVASWAIGVWGGVLGSLLLLFRSHWAVLMFWLSLLATLATALHTLVMAEVSMMDIAGTFALVFSIAIIIIAAAVVWYTRWMQSRRVLA